MFKIRELDFLSVERFYRLHKIFEKVPERRRILSTFDPTPLNFTSLDSLEIVIDACVPDKGKKKTYLARSQRQPLRIPIPSAKFGEYTQLCLGQGSACLFFPSMDIVQ
jgi:hypothetical protein